MRVRVKMSVVVLDLLLVDAADEEEERDEDARAVLAMQAMDEDGRGPPVLVLDAQLRQAQLECPPHLARTLGQDEPVDVCEAHLVKQLA